MKEWWTLAIQTVYDAIYILREARMFHGDSAAALGHKIGVSKRTILEWERGRVKPRKLTPYARDYIIEYVTEAIAKKKIIETPSPNV